MLKSFWVVLLLGVAALANAQPLKPTFKGGQAALDNFIASKIIYPEFSSQNCIASVIQVSFFIDTKGRVSDARVVKGPGIDLDEEAVRVVKLTSGHWMLPAGYTNPVRVVLPINFTPDYKTCQNRQGSMDEAIRNYQNRQELENAVTNYYINKYKGKADTAKEPEIIALKKQLGIDDELLNDVLEQANKKQQQGDIEGACKDWNFIRNTGSNLADSYITKYCK